MPTWPINPPPTKVLFSIAGTRGLSIFQPLRRNLCVNEELLRLGLCKISQLSDITDLGIASNQNMVKYLDRLVRLEHQAAKKGVGMWTETKEKSITRKGLNMVKNLVVGPFNMLRWVFRKMRRKKT